MPIAGRFISSVRLMVSQSNSTQRNRTEVIKLDECLVYALLQLPMKEDSKALSLCSLFFVSFFLSILVLPRVRMDEPRYHHLPSCAEARPGSSGRCCVRFPKIRVGNAASFFVSVFWMFLFLSTVFSASLFVTRDRPFGLISLRSPHHAWLESSILQVWLLHIRLASQVEAHAL